MSEMKFNLLMEPLISVVEEPTPACEVSLPGLLALLGQGRPIEFPALQPHQFHAWHAFLCQLGALGALRAGDNDLRRSEDSWRAVLRSLTDGRDEPWCLVVPDLSMPAFMQPPVPEGNLNNFKNSSRCPDKIDLLVTGKNHDVKASRILGARPQHWLFAILTLQTMQGYLGRGNFGIARMNSGFGNRPAMAAAPDLSWPARFVRDASLWLQSLPALTGEDGGYSPEASKALLWLDPWDGASSIPLQDCHPFFIEVCRRIRLVSDPDSGVGARFAPSELPRVDAKDSLGRTGDIWTPIRREDGAALNVGPAGFSYKLLQDILFEGNYERNPALALCDADGDEPLVEACALTRGQGRTEGLHEKVLPIPPRVRSLLCVGEGRSRLGAIARDRVEVVDTLRTKALRPALIVLAQGAPDKPDWKDKRMDTWSSCLDREVDRLFFPSLWACVDLDPPEARRIWAREVVKLARSILHQAMKSVPIPAVRRYRALAAAERSFEGGWRKHFPDLGLEKGVEGT